MSFFYDASGASEPTDSGTPEAGSLRAPGCTSNGDTRPSSLPISRVAGSTSSAIKRMLVVRASAEIGPWREFVPAEATYAFCAVAASSQMLRSRVSGIRNRLSTKAIAGTAIG